MATLSLTNTFIAGTLAKASEVNQNFTDLVNWSSGNIQNDNIGILNGAITWSVTTGVKAISIANSGNEGSIGITQSVALNPNKSTLRIIDNATQVSGDAEIYVSMTSISSTIPILKLDYAGSQVFAVKRDRLEFPSRTTTERDVISSPAVGSVLFNSSKNQAEVRTSSAWVAMGVPTGVCMAYAGTLAIPAGWLECNGSQVSQATYPELYAQLQSTWGPAGGGLFYLPEGRGRAIIGAGTGPGLTNRGQGDFTIGSENLQTHSHTGTTGAGSAHSHGVSDPGHAHGTYVVDVVGATIFPNVGSAASTQPAGPTQNATTGISINAESAHTHNFTSGSTGTGNAQNMQPSAVMTWIIKT